MTGRFNGDGFVLEQSPAAGSAARARHGVRADTRPAAAAAHRSAAVTLGDLLARPPATRPTSRPRGPCRRAAARARGRRDGRVGDERFASGRPRVGVRRAQARAQGGRRRLCPRRDRPRRARRGRRSAGAGRTPTVPWLQVATPGSRSPRCRPRSSAIRATTSCSSASPAPTARPRPRICWRRSSKRPAFAADESARSATRSPAAKRPRHERRRKRRSCSACCARW